MLPIDATPLRPAPLGLRSLGLLATTLALALAPLPEAGANWPQWRGPLGTGSAPGAEPPLTWSESANVRWKTPIPGFGTSTPVVWNDLVFLLAAAPADGSPATPAPI